MISELRSLSENNLMSNERILALLKETDVFIKVSEDFFANVLINDDDENIRKNRIIIATVVKNVLDSYLDFSCLY